MADAFDAALEELWQAGPGGEKGIDWGELGVPAPRALDSYTREALHLLEPPEPPAWRKRALPHQLEAADAEESYTVLLGGRGSGKTHGAAHALAGWIEEEPGDYAIVAPTFGDAVKICVDGPSGFVKAAGDAIDHVNRGEYVIYMRNGSRVVLASADAAARVRGWNLTGFWCDELASFKDETVWTEGLEFATRIGRTRRIVTTTPKRGTRGGPKILKELVERAGEGDRDIRVIRASTRANEANLSETFLRTVESRYAGTTLGQQELGGELLADVEGALVTAALIEDTRIRAPQCPDFTRVVVGVDPAVSNTARSDEVGIVVAGLGPAPAGWEPPAEAVGLADAPHVYFLEDYSGRMSVDAWGRAALQAAEEWAADAIVAETNQGGDLVASQIRSVAAATGMRVPRIQSVTASVGKRTRAEPGGSLFEQHRAHFVGTAMPELAEQWQTWVPGEDRVSPDRLDASVWAVVALMPELGRNPATEVRLLLAA